MLASTVLSCFLTAFQLVADFSRRINSKSGALFAKWPKLQTGILEVARREVKDAFGKAVVAAIIKGESSGIPLSESK